MLYDPSIHQLRINLQNDFTIAYLDAPTIPNKAASISALLLEPSPKGVVYGNNRLPSASLAMPPSPMYQGLVKELQSEFNSTY